MHAARWSQPGPATGARSNTIRTPKIDRLDLLVRVINLRADGVAQALSPAETAHADWDDLFDQAEQLGRQWAVSDPTGAPQLLPALLPGLPRIAEHFERGYSDAVHAAAGSSQRGEVCTRMPRRGVCGICETDVTLLLQAIPADQALMACPCCGEAWEL